MSGLEKFKSNESWRTNFKKLLFLQRASDCKVVDPLRMANRFSLDIVDDLEILATNQQYLKDENMKNLDSIENKESRKRCFNDPDHIGNAENINKLTFNIMEQNSFDDVALYYLDDSFEALEKMCNKTGSDPNSTLFKYLESNKKHEILAKVKQTTNAIKINGHRCELDDGISMKDVTQLEDIEAPSILWENTVSSDMNLPTSPLKMVRPLRPSTILEENNEGNTVNSSDLSSYYTAFRSMDSKGGSGFESDVDVIHQDTSLEYLKNYPKMDCNNTLQSVKSDDTSNKTKNDHQIEGICESDSSNSIIEVLSDDDAGSDNYNTMNSIQHSNITDDDNQLQFNDTLEEVEYMLKKRLDYISATPVECGEKNAVEMTGSIIKKKSKSISPKVPNKDMQISTKHETSHFEIDIKPFPKLSVFKHPAAKSGMPLNRNRDGLAKQFAHVVSPIGMYMKNTATTPLMSTMKCINKHDFSTTSAFKDVGFKSRLQQTPLTTIESNALYSNIDDIPTGPMILPKKAYISCNLKQVTDERTPMKIPGGKKIQKYLEPAMLPAVVRHDGKIKNRNHKENRLESYKSNDSLVDLSVASGDVSLYTVLDARKF